MAKLNQWQFVGNLGADPEERFSQAGNRIISFRVAVNADRKRGEEWEQNTLWVRVSAIGDRWNWLSERLKKGVPVFVQGKLDVSTYEKREGGGMGFSLEVLANDVQVFDRPEAGAGNGRASHWDGGSSAKPASSGTRPAAASNLSGRNPALAEPPDDLEDLPF